MAKPLRIGTLIDVDRPLPDVVTQLRRAQEAGFDHAFAVQIFGPDALTLLAAAGPQVPGIGLGTGVVPGLSPPPDDAGPAGADGAGGHRQPPSPRHRALPPGRGRGGVGHELRQARLLHARVPGLADADAARARPSTARASRSRPTPSCPSRCPGATAPPVLVAALGPAMLKLAGTVADGTVTWMTGTETIASHVAPTIRAGGRGGGPARAAGRRLPARVGDGRRGRGQGADPPGVLHLSRAALLQGDAGPGGCGRRGRHRVRRRRGDRGRRHHQAGRRRCDRLRRLGGGGQGRARPRRSRC